MPVGSKENVGNGNDILLKCLTFQIGQTKWDGGSTNLENGSRNIWSDMNISSRPGLIDFKNKKIVSKYFFYWCDFVSSFFLDRFD